ncbi:hypothetical protein MPTK1_7g07660 [Marchantia polymorpha subsp. ruderalis]|uniref:Uncharacterized protein n=2 Tax=Marchantia polymorpha TaxID=3197 RepID=A0AAF6BX60_MARPO|nr:hypothetical protein MARPO_0076s0028 [Marchantia polymorpha]BBN16594.1 hypothetical protein Mp_7g07660 [Marchantia polymorpha subsp. ruderalis]|eukprot:PTQ34783.1 hypothetical protein MARPO_0076s0028 [Marchantia polymorpha]
MIGSAASWTNSKSQSSVHLSAIKLERYKSALVNTLVGTNSCSPARVSRYRWSWSSYSCTCLNPIILLETVSMYMHVEVQSSRAEASAKSH